VAVRDWLRLARVPLAPTAACDALACALLARAPGFARGGAGRSLDAVAVGLLVATALLVYAFGMAANDLADRRRDATIAPDRPLPSGRISPAAALAFVLACGGLALALGGGPAGSRAAVGAALACAALYDGLAKRSAYGGAAVLGLARAGNAATAVLPLVLAGEASPWALVGPAAVGVYATGVTVLSTTEDRPARTAARTLVARVLAFVAFAAAAAASWAGAERPTIGAVLAGSVCLSVAFGRVPRPGPPKRRVLEMLLALYFLDAALATGATAPMVGFLALGAAFALVWLSQVAIRALRPR
jgi:4-hydroxybenzoate polyprenyltransferase